MKLRSFVRVKGVSTKGRAIVEELGDTWEIIRYSHGGGSKCLIRSQRDPERYRTVRWFDDPHLELGKRSLKR